MSFISSAHRSFARHEQGPLSNEQIAALAPSAFAAHAHESRSERYAYIPTSSVIDGLRENGFLPVLAKQGNSRIPGKADFTKHMLRFRYQGQGAAMRSVGETFPEIVLINSHDGTSAYHIMSGLFRLVCLNGMVIADKMHGSVSVQHKGNVVDNVIDASFTVLEDSRKALDAAESWATISLNRDERQVLAESAHLLRFGDSEGETDTAIRPDQFLVPRRREDGRSDLWTTFNVVQENAIRGGLTAIGRDANRRRRRTTTRAVNGIDQDVKLNKALWLLGERMAALKSSN
jgi:hypothetical protein